MASEFDLSEENNLTRIEAQKQAVLYRMVTSQKICVHGLKAKDLLKRNGYRVDDRHLKDPDAIQTFKKAHNVPSLPQVFIETLAGLLMMVGAFTIVMAPITLIAASIGALSVFKAVYIDKRDLKCACVGGDSKVPLGFISLLENIMMLGMAAWMLTKLLQIAG